MDQLSRREFIQTAFALGATAAMAGASGKPSTTTWRERRDLFPEGVASAEPTFDSVLLWTRYPAGVAATAATPPRATAQSQPGAAAADAATQTSAAVAGPVRSVSKPTTADLTVEVATDPAFQNVIATSTAKATAASDWTCRVLIGALQPSHEYWYRFTDKHGNGSR